MYIGDVVESWESIYKPILTIRAGNGVHTPVWVVVGVIVGCTDGKSRAREKESREDG